MPQTVGVFFGSTTSNTAEVAEQIAETFAYPCDLHDIADSPLSLTMDYSHIVFGISTWDFGELQEDWDDHWAALADLDFTGKTVAVYGLGDQLGYGEWFVDAMGMLHQRLAELGATLVGKWPNDGYKFDASKALSDDKSHFVGLALDQDTQRYETDERIEQWVGQLAQEFDDEVS